MLILGLNAYHAEASACLLDGGELIAAAEEERFSRVKHAAGFPSEAIRYCLAAAGASPEQLDCIAVSRDPKAHLLARGAALLRRGPFSRAALERVRALASSAGIKQRTAEALGVPESMLRAELTFVEHHRAHIASSFYASGWDDAAVLSLDGFGDTLSAMWGAGSGTDLRFDGHVSFPHSLGILYTALTQFLGFTSWGDEYKVMGLAAFGKPERFRGALERLVRADPRCGYRIDMRYFRHHRSDCSMTWAEGAPTLGPVYDPRIESLLGPPRAAGAAVDERHADIAAALQERLESVALELMRRLGERYRNPRLCYAGGVALNCVLNAKIAPNTPFRQVFIQPAAHDAGTSLGAALYAAHQLKKLPRRFVMRHAAWGPEARQRECEEALHRAGVALRRLDEPQLCQVAARALADGKIIGWFQGRMEFGPRALGHRSLLADPRDPAMKDRINERVKRREAFRPFAPSVLAAQVDRFFEGAHPDPFMLFTYPVRPGQRGRIPSAVHVDGTGRLQAVDPEIEPLYANLLTEFDKLAGVPVLLNTSFNEQEPIVCRPEEAIACFERNAIDCLALGPYWIEREGRR